MSEIARAEQRIEDYCILVTTHPENRLNTLYLKQLLAHLESAVRMTDTRAPF